MHPDDRLRTVWLFGRPYWWTTEEQRLVLRPANWLFTEAHPECRTPMPPWSQPA